MKESPSEILRMEAHGKAVRTHREAMKSRACQPSQG